MDYNDYSQYSPFPLEDDEYRQNPYQGPPGFPGGAMPPGQQPGFPGGFPPPGQQPGFPSGGQQQGGGPPTSPPPSFTPQQQQVSTFAVDPGAIRGCLFRNTYIWLRSGRSFWFYPTYVGRTSVAGWRWRNFRWTYYGTDLNRISSFRCF
ncbi:transporter [Bacillus sp. REN10]|uniref:transporter n=1 Tax=Bacillus sp. REN10 TaxID=2782541 RepID=UPI00193C51CA|nr:transporter [Bacillus sp. REN10]